jgi:hypothetical protein
LLENLKPPPNKFIDQTTAAPIFLPSSPLIKDLKLLDFLATILFFFSSLPQSKWVSPTFLPMLELPCSTAG